MVTVVGDLLQLAVAAAIRLRVSSSPGSTSGGTAAFASSSHLLRENVGSGQRGDSTPVRRIRSIHQFFREMGHDEGASPNVSEAVAQKRVNNAPNGEGASEGQHRTDSHASEEARAQMWENLRNMHDWLRSPDDQYPDRLCAAKRLQEFVACRGKDWEVNNCCIDGEGRCFFTVARGKSLSPVEERGMIFCLNTSGPVARAVVLRFGRGITQSAVISLSLAAHPNSGCILMVEKSAAEVRSGVLSPGISPPFSLIADCHPQQGNAATISGRLRGHDAGAKMDRANSASATGVADTIVSMPRRSGQQDSSETLSVAEGTLAGQGGEDTFQRSRDNTQARAFILQEDTRDGAAGGLIQGEGLGQARHTPTTDNSDGSLQPPTQPTSVREQARNTYQEGQQAAEGERDEELAGEHSTWWFCPCDDDPSFFFPVADYFDDDAIHNAAQSICRQFRGNASSSVCRAYFEDDSGIALREAKAAATAARIAELTITAAIHAEGRHGSGRKQVHAFSVASAAKEPRQAVRDGVLVALKEADIAASRAESVENRGYILWQPGVKVRRPKTGEEAISFGSAILLRAHTSFRREAVSGWGAGPPRPLQPPYASDLITGELVAAISQDARHLEVRDAFPSPLGLLVVPAEAANRIVKQEPDCIPSRITSRNSFSFTSFLASFIAGNSLTALERDNQGGVTTPPAQGVVEDVRPFAVESHLSDSPPAGGAASHGTYRNALQDSVSRRAVPAVNIVFLVDTLRVCRLAEARLAHTLGGSGQNVLQPMCDQRLLGLADAATSATCEQFTFESSQSWKKDKTEDERGFAVFGGLPTSDTVNQPTSDSKRGKLCSCRKPDACTGGPPNPVLHAQFTDVTLLCADGCEVFSHRALLAARCSFFEAKLTRPHWEARGADKVVIDLRGFAGSVVQATVRFFETGYFVIPASCCCPRCCLEQRRDRYGQFQARQQRGLPPYESQCCCRVEWVLQAYTFAAYCLLEDLKTEILAILARLISQRTCLHVLTHPAVRNQRRILQLAAHQLVYHMPMPNLLLDVDGFQEWRLPPDDNNLLNANDKSPSGGGRSQEQKSGKPLITLLLSEGIYEPVVKALSAWVLDTQDNIILLSKLHYMGNCDTSSPCLRPRQLLVLLALRLLQESVTAPLSTLNVCQELPDSRYNVSRMSRTALSGESHSVPASSIMPTSGHFPDKISLVVPLSNSREALRYFLFRDVVLLWAKLLDVPEEDANVVAQGLEYSCLP